MVSNEGSFVLSMNPESLPGSSSSVSLVGTYIKAATKPLDPIIRKVRHNEIAWIKRYTT